jgi:hypothetical protein
MTTKFREPTNELPQPFYLSSGGGEPPWTSHKAMQKVRPLTDEECDDLLTKFERGGIQEGRETGGARLAALA